MSSPNEITVAQLSRLVGTPDAPVIVDVRGTSHRDADPRFLPCALARDSDDVGSWAQALAGQRVVAVCEQGHKRSQGVAAWLRHEGAEAEFLGGGVAAWRAEGGLLVRLGALPPRDAEGRTRWVTRARPKVDRIACPWLIRRFVDAHAVFLFVTAAEVANTAETFGAAPFDIEGVFFGHRGERCSFDTMIEEFGLDSEPLRHRADIVRGADTARPDLAPEALGFLAASLGYSRMYREDLPQLDAAMSMYDAFYRWCRDAREETHNWPAPQQAAKA